jgi:hypothetical protein
LTCHRPSEGFKKLKNPHKLIYGDLLYLYDMKLINCLRYLILESEFQNEFKIFPSLKRDMEVILLYQTKHQRWERNGEGIIDNELIDKIYLGEYESGVNTNVIVESIDNNFYEIFDNFVSEIEQNDGNGVRIIFVDEFNLLDDVYIEYILAGKLLNETTLKVTIITSAYSTDKNFFKKLKNYDTTLVSLTESFSQENLKVVYLF